jgi:hypothetical protein
MHITFLLSSFRRNNTRLMCLSFDAFMVYNFGWMSVGYFLLSMLLGLGPHPMAGHFIAGTFCFVSAACRLVSNCV